MITHIKLYKELTQSSIRTQPYAITDETCQISPYFTDARHAYSKSSMQAASLHQGCDHWICIRLHITNKTKQPIVHELRDNNNN